MYTVPASEKILLPTIAQSIATGTQIISDQGAAYNSIRKSNKNYTKIVGFHGLHQLM